MEAEKTKKARKPRKQPKVHVEVVGSWGQAHRIKRGKTNEHNRNCTD